MPVQYSPIGRARLDGGDHAIEIEPAFRPGLVGLDGFSWITVLWHADQAPVLIQDDLVTHSPYRNAPEAFGIFATRSPARPNAICLSVAALVGVDVDTGILRLGWMDCADNTPILDIKPYHPSADRVEAPKMPDWCADWPKSIDTSGDFDWNAVFNF